MSQYFGDNTVQMLYLTNTNVNLTHILSNFLFYSFAVHIMMVRGFIDVHGKGKSHICDGTVNA